MQHMNYEVRTSYPASCSEMCSIANVVIVWVPGLLAIRYQYGNIHAHKMILLSMQIISKCSYLLVYYRIVGQGYPGHVGHVLSRSNRSHLLYENI